MICYMLFVLLTIFITGIYNNVGTTIFRNRNVKYACWTPDDVAKLRARKIFEQLMPGTVAPDKINTKYAKDVLRYFRDALRAVENQDSQKTGILKEALADAIGGNMKSNLLPAIRFAYYAGYVPFRNARQLHDFFEELKTTLNTQGLGWTLPNRVPQWTNISVVKILIGSGKLFDPCTSLILKRDSNSCIRLDLPKFDNHENPSAIALPFVSGGLYSLEAAGSENILLKYYTTGSRCILRKSPKNCRHRDFVTFNNDMWHWMKREVAPHLVDEKLYSAFGGVLRIAAAVQSYGKGLSRRNLFQYSKAEVESRWHPWALITHPSIVLNGDWTPGSYIGLVFVVALVICLLQICFHRIFGGNRCNCNGPPICNDEVIEIAYANTDSNFPAMLPEHQSTVYYSDAKNLRSPLKLQTSSLGSMKTQKVYDLNENTEKLMTIMSSHEVTEIDSPTSKLGSETVDDEELTKRPKSPPKLETPIAQLRITPRADRIYRTPAFSTSTVTHSDFHHQQSESLWSGSASSTSQSESSGSSKSRKSRSNRDLAWARRVISKQTQNQSKSTTDNDFSYLVASQRRQR